MADLPTLDDFDPAGRRIVVRSDFNVPLDDGVIADDFRIGAGLATIAELLDRGAERIAIMTHLGRPDGADRALSTEVVAERLAELGGFEVAHAADVAGPASADALDSHRVVMIENTRFEPGETENDPELAERMASLGDVFVNDAFGSAHRAHASTVGVAERLPSYAGRLLAAEVEAMRPLLDSPGRPFVVVLGGAKVSDKLGVMRNLLPRVDRLLVGGAMAFTLMVANGCEVGASRLEPDMVDEVRDLLESEDGAKVMVPVDVVVADRFDADAEHEVVEADAMPEAMMGLDIGPVTAERFAEAIAGSETVFWNGPMGVFEFPAFAEGTKRVAEAVAAAEAFTVIGGGDTVAAIGALELMDAYSHVSSGGGAGLEMLEGKELPGVAALRGAM